MNVLESFTLEDYKALDTAETKAFQRWLDKVGLVGKQVVLLEILDTTWSRLCVHDAMGASWSVNVETPFPKQFLRRRLKPTGCRRLTALDLDRAAKAIAWNRFRFGKSDDLDTSGISDRDMHVVAYRQEGQTLEEIGYHYGLSRQRVRQIVISSGYTPVFKGRLKAYSGKATR